MNIKKTIFVLLKYIFLALVLYYVGKFMFKSIGDLQKVDVRIDYKFIVFAYITHFVYLFTRSIIWHYITRLNNASIRLTEAITIWFVSLLGKFIPGKVFYLGLRVYHYKKKGESGSSIVFSFFLEYMTGIAASVLLFVLSFSFIPKTVFHAYRPYGILLSCVILIALHPKILSIVFSLMEKVIKKKMPDLGNVRYLDILKLTIMYFCAWAVMGLGFYFVARSIYPLPLVDYLYVSGAFSLATIIGILSLFAPSGIGVREGVIIATMSQIVSSGIASIMAIIARIWATSSELFWVGVVYVISLLFGKEKISVSRHSADVLDA